MSITASVSVEVGPFNEPLSSPARPDRTARSDVRAYPRVRDPQIGMQSRRTTTSWPAAKTLGPSCRIVRQEVRVDSLLKYRSAE